MITAVKDYENSDDEGAKTAYDQFVNRVTVSDYTAENFDGPEEEDGWTLDDYKINLGFKTPANPDGKLDVTDDPATVESAESAIIALASDALTLTADPDDLVGNVFIAPRVWNPDGSDQMNSLNDDDVLTGEGDNPTLNVTIVNDSETGDLSIMPNSKQHCHC